MNLTKEDAYFGKLLMKYARDHSIWLYNGIENGTITSPSCLKLHKEMECFTDEQKQIVRKIMVKILNNCLHDTMFMFEEHDEDLHLMVDAGDGFKNIQETSDGLEGDLWDWIDEYSELEKDY